MFLLHAPFKPTGDQPQAIAKLTNGLNNSVAHQVLLGVTGSGKTFTIANVIKNVQKPTLVITHNKTLAAQLYGEFKEFFPNNAVEYFVSYYDYYQPEAYLPATDTYIEKETAINEEIDRLRHSATKSLMTRRDTIVVASVSCIYGLGLPEEYFKNVFYLKQGLPISRTEVLHRLIAMMYERNDQDLYRGKFRVKGDTLEIVPIDQNNIIRLEFFGDELEKIYELEQTSFKKISELNDVAIYPAKHYLTKDEKLETALKNIEEEMLEQVKFFEAQKDLVAAHRIKQRTLYDLEMIREIGYCNGIENYSRHLELRAAGAPPATLIDYFPKDFLLVLDESHVSVPQIGGMYEGDKARKERLIEYGFRLPSAKDNRPLRFEEFIKKIKQTIYLSATPREYETGLAGPNAIIEQLLRPTGLLDPQIVIKPVAGQVDNLIAEARQVIARQERVFVTTLTKRMAEELSDYLKKLDFKVSYLHSEIDVLERVQILHDLRAGKYDILVGINLLREGLDIPEVSLVAILDADKEGFLRSERSLIQTIGRAARNVNGRVILYADNITGSIRKAVSETTRRRKIQHDYNKKQGITPQTIKKELSAKSLARIKVELAEDFEPQKLAKLKKDPLALLKHVDFLRKEMQKAAAELEFEKAAILRDEIEQLTAE